MVSDMGLHFKEIFSPPSLALFSFFISFSFFFLNVQSVFTQSRNGPQKRSGWINAAIWMPVAGFTLEGPSSRQHHACAWVCAPIRWCAQMGLHLTCSLSPQFLLSSLKLLLGRSCSACSCALALDLAWFAIQKALSQYCRLLIKLESFK